MRWKPIIEGRYHRLTEWHAWFAWHPVRVGASTVWLETVERKGTLRSAWHDMWWDFEYRERLACYQHSPTQPALPISPQDQGPMMTPPPPGWNERRGAP